MKEDVEEARRKIEESQILEGKIKWLEIKHDEDVKRKEDLLDQLRD